MTYKNRKGYSLEVPKNWSKWGIYHRLFHNTVFNTPVFADGADVTFLTSSGDASISIEAGPMPDDIQYHIGRRKVQLENHVKDRMNAENIQVVEGFFLDGEKNTLYLTYTSNKLGFDKPGYGHIISSLHGNRYVSRGYEREGYFIQASDENNLHANEIRSMLDSFRFPLD